MKNTHVLLMAVQLGYRANQWAAGTLTVLPNLNQTFVVGNR